MDGINLGHNFTIRIKKCGPDSHQLRTTALL